MPTRVFALMRVMRTLSAVARVFQVALLVAATLVAPAAGAQGGRSIRVEERHFTLTLPEGWIAMGAEELERINQVWAASQGGSAATKYLLGFKPQVQPPEGTVLVLVEWESSQNASMTRLQVEALLRTNIEAVMRDLGVSSGAELSEPTFDWERSRMFFMTSLPSPTGPVEAISYGMLAMDGVAWIHCYTPAQRMGEMGPQFARIANGVVIDPAYSFVASPEGQGAGTATGGPGNARGGLSAAQMVMILGLVVLIVGVLVIRARASRGSKP